MTQQNNSLQLLCPGWVCTPSVLLLPHAAGELQSVASSFDVARPRVGGHHHSLL
jgi:hypothetical protein